MGDAVPPDTSIELAPANLDELDDLRVPGLRQRHPGRSSWSSSAASTRPASWTGRRARAPSTCSPSTRTPTRRWRPARTPSRCGPWTRPTRSCPTPTTPSSRATSTPRRRRTPGPASPTRRLPAPASAPACLPPSARRRTRPVEFFGTDNATPTTALEFQCSVDGAAWAGCTSPTDVSGLEPGAHELRIRSVDLAGNVDTTPAVENFTVVASPVTTITSGPAGRIVGRHPDPAEQHVGERGLRLRQRPARLHLRVLPRRRGLPPLHLAAGLLGRRRRCPRARDPRDQPRGRRRGAAGQLSVEGRARAGRDDPATTILTGPPAFDASTVATFTFGGSDNRTPVANLSSSARWTGRRTTRARRRSSSPT